MPLRGSDLLVLVCCLSGCGFGGAEGGGASSALQKDLWALLESCLLRSRLGPTPTPTLTPTPTTAAPSFC
jgi:hypothetical protein